jgi:hypothetical protein
MGELGNTWSSPSGERQDCLDNNRVMEAAARLIVAEGLVEVAP